MRTAWPLIPILLQALVLPFFIVASHAVIYDGLRHELFMFPALLAIPAVALALLDRERDGACAWRFRWLRSSSSG